MPFIVRNIDIGIKGIIKGTSLVRNLNVSGLINSNIPNIVIFINKAIYIDVL